MKIWNPNNRWHDDISRKGRFLGLLIAALLAVASNLGAQDAGSVPSSSDTSADDTVSPVAASMNSMIALNDQAKLGKGDRVSYRVIEEQKDPIILMVSDSGELEVPLVGRITAAGKTCKQLAYEIKPLLEKEYFYHATVIVGVDTLSTLPLGKVYLMGQVHTQGAVEIPANETLTVSKAILLVGGLADFADRRKVKLVRKKADGTSQTTIVDLVEILDKGHAERDPVLQPEDMIIVPQRLINF